MVSFIVTHKREISYLRDCLESIAAQEFKDYETILVVDHTEDDLSDLINEFSDLINLKVYELKEKTGVSAARNLGMDKASGEYLFFMDNDDYLYGEFIEGLLNVMEEDSDMAYGKVKHTWFQRTVFNQRRKELEELAAAEEPEGDQEEATDEEEAPQENLSKRKRFLQSFEFEDSFNYRYIRYRKLHKVSLLGAIYKKSLFTDNNIRFDEDQLYFADIAVVTSIFRYAKNIKCSEEGYYVKRHHNDKQHNPALVQYTREETMPDYFKAYKSAFEAAGDDEVLKDHLGLIVGKFIVKEYLKKLRWSEDERWKGEYYKGLVELTQTMRRKSIKKENFNSLERKMIYAFMDDDFERMQKLSLKILVRRKIKKLLKSKKARKKAITLHIFNKMELKENWIVFESFMGRNCSGQPKYIYKYLKENYGDKYKYIWIVSRKGVKIPGKGYKKCRRFGLRYYYYMNRSKYWVNNMRQPLGITRRPETVMLSTWHGTPLKRLVFDMEDVLSANPRYKDIVYRQTRGWDYLLSDNPFSTEKFQSCFLFDKEKILEYGYPANDPMYAPDREEHAAKIKQKLGIPADKKVILYAPTWRDDQFYEKGQYGFELDLDINRMQEEFGDEYVLLLRLHYFIVDQLDLSVYGDFTVDGSSYDDITDLYLVSDMLITDYSSVFFDYANLKRPVLYYTYDLEKYRDVLRGFYLDMEKDLPGPLLLTNDEVIDAIKNIDKIEEQYKDRYEEFYNRFCCVDDGNAAKRVVEKVFK